MVFRCVRVGDLFMMQEKLEIVEEEAKKFRISLDIAEASLWDYEKKFYVATISLGFVLLLVVML